MTRRRLSLAHTHHPELIFTENIEVENWLENCRPSFTTTTNDTIVESVESAKMAPSNLPPIFNPTSQDVEMMLAAQAHLGSKNLQVHMEPYLWKTRPDGVNVINISKTW
jgi:hypothetical protein